MLPAWTTLTILLSASCLALTDPNNDEELSSNQRRGRFFVSTSTYTSVITTNDNCYVALSSTGTGMLGCKKRRRNLRYLNDHVASAITPISPSPSSSEEEKKSSEPSSEEISSSYVNARAQRFLYYWATYTVTSTSYSYTATSSLASLFCTPPDYTVPPCAAQMAGKKKKK